jgi:hypothetical protein
MKSIANKFDIGMKFDSGKPDWSLLPMGCIEEAVKILTFGAEKYGIDNWKKLNSDRDIDRIYSAMMRHIVSHKNGDKFDDESGMLHLSHAITNMIFLLYNELNKTNE